MLQQVRTFRRGVLVRAIKRAGSATALARACGVKTAAITNAKARCTISPELALAIDHALQGDPSASEFRPDLWVSPDKVPTIRQWRKADAKARKRNGRSP